MSYILDALKKSETERNQKSGASLLSYNANTRVKGVPVWIIVAVTVLINAVALLYWHFNQSPASLAGNNTQPAVVVDQVLPERIIEATTDIVPPGDPATLISPKPVAFASLSASQKRNFPNIEFSTHIYGQSPELRAVVANGRKLVENEAITPQVRLISITETGIIVQYDRRLIDIPVLENWRSP